MKFFIVICYLCFFGRGVWAQNSIEEKMFINDVIKSQNIFYIDSVYNSAANMRNAIKYNVKKTFVTLHPDSVVYRTKAGYGVRMLRSDAVSQISKGGDGWMIPIVMDSIILADREVAFIINQFSETSNRKWSTSLIAGSQQIAKDSVTAILNSKSRGWYEMNKKGVNEIYGFSTPVFIRKNTYCIFNSGSICGSKCAYGRLAIYKKENGKWCFWGEISSEVS